MPDSAPFRAAALALILWLIWRASRRTPPTTGAWPGTTTIPRSSAATPDAVEGDDRLPRAGGLGLELFAAEPLLANPVAFGFDEKGRTYVVETFRLKHGVTDNRGHMNWLDDDLASRTVADRVAMYRKHLGKEAETYGIEHDRIRLVEDRDGDGKADHATVFADGFHDLASGLGRGRAGTQGRRLLHLHPRPLAAPRHRTATARPTSDSRSSTGYGVHVAFLGHDLHGLTLRARRPALFQHRRPRPATSRPPTAGRSSCPDTGAVLRCEPDGSDLRIFATGLRNPQELAFDEFGNLFTVDNNSDSGDKARLVHVDRRGRQRLADRLPVPRAARQPRPLERREALASQRPRRPGRLPRSAPGQPLRRPLRPGLQPRRRPSCPSATAAISSWPTSAARAARAASASFTVKPKGAAFAARPTPSSSSGASSPPTSTSAPTAPFTSPTGSRAGTMTGKGRIYKVADPPSHPTAADEVKTLLAEGFDSGRSNELVTLLAHPDMRVRQESPVRPRRPPAGRGGDRRTPGRGRSDRETTLARLHAIWGLGQVGRKAAGRQRSTRRRPCSATPTPRSAPRPPRSSATPATDGPAAGRTDRSRSRDSPRVRLLRRDRARQAGRGKPRRRPAPGSCSARTPTATPTSATPP